ncbi:hypothetical protein B0H19DRAFT_1310039, partial [Mycena capillaripes]
LALKNLCYLLELDHKRPALNVLQASLTLARANQISWINDLRIVLSRLHVPVELDISVNLDVQTAQATMKAVKKSTEAWIEEEIASSSRVSDLLVGRLEMDKETGKLAKKSLDFRHYLRVKQPEHRKALTKMVLSSHSLAVNVGVGKSAARRFYPVSGDSAGSAISTWRFLHTRCSNAPNRTSWKFGNLSWTKWTLNFPV